MKRHFQKLKSKNFDVLIIGGGIYGAWVAYDAALRGLEVAIVDKGDWGGGTSSASSKLLHGGLRYLENLEFGLVQKSLQERQKLWELSAHRVKPLRFVIPNYNNNPVTHWKLRIGLFLYDWLAKKIFKNSKVPNIFKKRAFYKSLEFEEKFPFLSKEGLSKNMSGMEYSDGYHDDARTVLELIAGVVEKKGAAVNYAKATEFLWESKKKNVQIAGAVVQDQVTQEKTAVHAKITVHTAGPWVEELLFALSKDIHRKWKEGPNSFTLPQVCYKEDNPLQKRTKGVHLIMPPLPTEKAFLLFTPKDDRVFFMIPWYGKTLLGTTDTFYNESSDAVSVEEEDVEYLLEAANQYLDLKKAWTKEDICGQFVGLRSLANLQRNSRTQGTPLPSNVSRDWHVENPYAGLYISIGGKYTSARVDSAKLVQQWIGEFSDKISIHPQESTINNHGGAWSLGKQTESFRKNCFETGLEQGWKQEELELLFFRHGSQTQDILERVHLKGKHLLKRVHPELPFTFAEWEYVLEHEMVVCFEDIFRRRFPLALLRKWTSTEVESLKKSTELKCFAYTE
jgi:glycerol-3-phosphate dehydrogenase